jgi:hypothetical protein
MKSRLAAVSVTLAATLMLAAPNAQAAPNGTYKGKTDGEVAVKLKVKKNRIVDFETSVYASCYSGSYLITFAFPPAHQPKARTKIKGNGSFKVVFKGDPDVSFNDDKRTLKGKFKGGKVSGSIKVEGLCTGDAAFTAKRK